MIRAAADLPHQGEQQRSTSRARTSAAAQRGFTLVEVVIAVATLAVILGVAYSALSQIVRTKRALDDQRDVSVVANAVLERVVRELQMTTSGLPLLPPPDGAAASGTSGSLLGEAKDVGDGFSHDRITFLAQEAGQYLPDGGTHTGIVQITYHVETDKEASRGSDEPVYSLIRDEIPYIQSAGINNPAAWTQARKKAYEKAMVFPISNRIVSFKLRYYDDQQQEWVNEWGKSGAARNNPPRIVLISLAVRSPLGRVLYYTTSVPVGVNRTLNKT